jgi:hypothetical protein
MSPSNLSSPSPSLSPKNNNGIENVLILQDGGSLDAFGCGVFKVLCCTIILNRYLLTF